MKTIIVLGLMNSGSGAVHDYLSSRSDFESPFGTNEFKLCVDPMGLDNLYVNCYKNFSFFNPSNAINDFLDYVEKLQNYVVYESYGKAKKLFNQKLETPSLEFVNKITEILYYGNPEFSNFKISNVKSLYLKFKKKRYNFFKVRIPVKEKFFLKESKKYIEKIILNNINKKKLHPNKNIVLNQAANIFNPIQSSQYFEKRKIVIVTRDPRDMFSSMKKRKSKGPPSYNVKLFIKWYKKCFDNISFKKKLNNKLILLVKYEDFINNFNKENKKICKFLSISSNYKLKKNFYPKFNLEDSRKNLYKSKKFLSNHENLLIKKHLGKFLQW